MLTFEQIQRQMGSGKTWWCASTGGGYERKGRVVTSRYRFAKDYIMELIEAGEYVNREQVQRATGVSKCTITKIITDAYEAGEIDRTVRKRHGNAIVYDYFLVAKRHAAHSR